MAYSVDWDETAPDGASVLASDIDIHIQNDKVATRERLEDMFPDWANDAIDPKPPTGIMASGPTGEKPTAPTFDGQLFYDETVKILYTGTDIGGTPTWVDVGGSGSSILNDIYNKSRVIVNKTAAQSLVDATPTTISWDATVEISDAALWVIGAPTNIVVQETGTYLVALNTALAVTGGNNYYCYILSNGVNLGGNQSSDGSFCSVSIVQLLTAADIITARVHQNSGAAVNLGPTITFMSLIRLS